MIRSLSKVKGNNTAVSSFIFSRFFPNFSFSRVPEYVYLLPLCECSCSHPNKI